MRSYLKTRVNVLNEYFAFFVDFLCNRFRLTYGYFTVLALTLKLNLLFKPKFCPC